MWSRFFSWLRRVFWNDLPLWAASSVLAVLVWLYVDSVLTHRKEIQVPVQVTLPAGWVLKKPEEAPQVTIVVRGGRTEIEDLDAAKFRAQVVLSPEQARRGEQQLTVKPEHVKGPKGVNYALDETQDRNAFKVVLDKNETRLFQVEPDFTMVPIQYTALGSEVFPATVKVTAPAEDLAAIKSIRTEPVSLKDRTGNFERHDIKLVPQVTGGRKISATLEPPHVTIQVKVSEIKSDWPATLPLQVMGPAAPQYRFTIEPATINVTLTATHSVLARIRPAEDVVAYLWPTATEAADATKRPVIVKPYFVAPSGVSVTRAANVKIRAQPLHPETGRRTLERLPVNVRRPPFSKHTVTLKPSSITVLLEGPQERLAALKPQDVHAWVSLEVPNNETPFKGTLPVTVALPEHPGILARPEEGAQHLDVEAAPFVPPAPATRAVPVRVILKGKPPPGQELVEPPRPSPDLAVVTGKKEDLEQLSYFEVLVELAGRAETFTEKLTAGQGRTQENQALDVRLLHPLQVQVEIAPEKKESSLSVPVAVRFSGNATHQVRPEPATLSVVVRGRPEAMRQLQTGDVIATVALPQELPPGPFVLELKPEVNCRRDGIQTLVPPEIPPLKVFGQPLVAAKNASRKLEDVPVRVAHPAADQRVFELQPEKVALVVSGSPEMIGALQPAEVWVVVNVGADLKAGAKQKITACPMLPAGLSATAAEDGSLEIEVAVKAR